MIKLALGGVACRFQAVRIISSILFAMMAVVLPMASVQRYVCTLSMEFSGKTDDCPMTAKDCCKENHEVPDCMVEAKFLPDAEAPNSGQIPCLKADEVVFLGLKIMVLREIHRFSEHSPSHRAPPDSLEWYVKQQRLLI
jgi:hypothetical protein